MSSETLNLNIIQPEYFHREYKHDLPEEDSQNYYINQCKRITLVALPFLSLYKPLSFPLSLALGGLRSVSSLSQVLNEISNGNWQSCSYSLLQMTIALIALSGTILAHPLGMLITTVNDCAFDSIAIGQNLFAGDFQSAFGSTASLVNNTLYLGLFLHGGLEIAIASLAMQIILGLSNSVAEYQKGNYLEAGGHFLMGMIRGNQFASQIQTLQIKWKIEEILKSQPKERSAAFIESHSEKKQTFKFDLNSLTESDISITNTDYEPIPDDVIKIFQKYNGTTNVIDILNSKKITGETFEDLIVLMKHHLIRPDDFGHACKIAVERGAPLELIKLLLPERLFILESATYIDDLVNLALKEKTTKPGVLSFLYDRESVKNCQERDSYYMDWFRYELKLAGAFQDEEFLEFIQRKVLSESEIERLMNRMPVEVRRLSQFTSKLPPKFLDDHFFKSEKIDKRYEYALLALKYQTSKPTYFLKKFEKTSWEGGFVGQLMVNMNNLLGYGERGEYLLMELLKQTFPSKEYQNSNKDDLKAFLDFVSFQVANSGKTHPEQAIEVFQFISRESTLSLQEIYNSTKHINVKNFLKDYNLIS